MTEFRGVLPVAHIPYDENLAIDSNALGRQIDYAFDTGADGICLALASDLLRLTSDERKTLPKQLPEYAACRGPVIINVSAETAEEATDYALAARDGGAAALMSTPPLSQGLEETDMLRYFETILDAAGLPLIVQDASGYVGKPMRLDFQAGLLERFGDRVLFKPEAPPLGPTFSALLEKTGGKARLFDGSGGLLLVESYRRGVTGTIPGMEVLDGIVALWQALDAGDDERTYDLWLPICALGTLQMQSGIDAFLVVERYLMHKRGIFPRLIHRGPLTFELDATTRGEVDRLFDRLQRVLAH